MFLFRSSSLSTSQRTTTAHVLRPCRLLARMFPEEFTLVEDLFLPRPHGEGLTLVDAILSTPAGLSVICIEPGDGIIRGLPSDHEWTLAKPLRRIRMPNPMLRARFHSRAVARFLDLPAGSVKEFVCFPGKVHLESILELPVNFIMGSLSGLLREPPAMAWSPETHADTRHKLLPLTHPHQRLLARLSYETQQQHRT